MTATTSCTSESTGEMTWEAPVLVDYSSRDSRGGRRDKAVMALIHTALHPSSTSIKHQQGLTGEPDQPGDQRRSAEKFFSRQVIRQPSVSIELKIALLFVCLGFTS